MKRGVGFSPDRTLADSVREFYRPAAYRVDAAGDITANAEGAEESRAAKEELNLPLRF